ncbi:MAG: DoxX family membrane protein [Chloroflexi bacterium]|nr:DoxX family membrane protein [Chloroflexota bacterium]
MPIDYGNEKKPTVRSIISIVACLLIGLTLIFAGGGKLANLGQIPGQTEFLYLLIPDFLMTPEFALFMVEVFLPWILPSVEIILGLLLVIGIWPRLIALLVLPLVLGFMANNSYMISQGLDKYPDCTCFGVWEQWLGGLTPLQSMYYDVALFILAVIIIIVHPGSFFAHQFWINKIMSRDKA